MKNKNLLYLALAIGGIYFYSKYMKSKVTKTTTPMVPGTPPPNVVSNGQLTQPIINDMVNQEITNSDMVQNAGNNVHATNEYDVANTYQTLFGRTGTNEYSMPDTYKTFNNRNEINGIYRTCPTII